jgi:membrane associated rhomboid family serine protease
MARFTRYPMRRSYFYSSFPPGVKWLLIGNTVIFLICNLGGSAVQVPAGTLLGLSAEAAIHHFLLFQVFTYMFLHFATMHVLFNMLGLWFFGKPIEETWGTRRFLKFYFLCGIAAGVCVVLANALNGSWGTVTIGASGAIFGTLVAFGILFPDSIILMFFVFPMKAKYAVMIYVAIELLATFGPNTGVSTVAHLGGAAFAYLYLKQRLPRFAMPDISGVYRQWKLQRAKKKFQVYMKKHGRGGGGPWVN